MRVHRYVCIYTLMPIHAHTRSKFKNHVHGQFASCENLKILYSNRENINVHNLKTAENQEISEKLIAKFTFYRRQTG